MECVEVLELAMLVLEALQNLEGVLGRMRVPSTDLIFNVAGVSINVVMFQLGEWVLPVNMTLISSILLSTEEKCPDKVDVGIHSGVLMMHLVEVLFLLDLTLRGADTVHEIEVMGYLSQPGVNHFPLEKDSTDHTVDGILMTLTSMMAVHMERNDHSLRQIQTTWSLADIVLDWITLIQQFDFVRLTIEILLKPAAASTPMIITALTTVKVHIHLFMGMIARMEVAITTRIVRLWWIWEAGKDVWWAFTGGSGKLGWTPCDAGLWTFCLEGKLKLVSTFLSLVLSIFHFLFMSLSLCLPPHLWSSSALFVKLVRRNEFQVSSL